MVAMPWWVLPALAVVVELVFVVALVIAWMGNDSTLLTTMCTAAITQVLLPFGFFFGSSKGSQDKDAAMAVSAARKDETIADTAVKQNETIAAQSVALGTSAPAAATVTTTTLDPGPPPTMTTTTKPPLTAATAGAAPAKPPCPGKDTH